MKLITFLLSAVSIALSPGMASASAYPSQPIKIVVPFGAGSSTDILTRGVAEGLSKELGQPVVVENKAGAGGAIGAAAVAGAKPDGYTLIMGSNGPFAANVSLYSELAYDPIKDFVPVILMGKLPMMLIAGPSSKASTVKEIIAQAKAHPEQVNFGASNTTARVWVELLKKTAGIDAGTVLYSNVGRLMTDIVGGQIPYAFENVGPSRPMVEADKVEAVAVTSDKRVDFAPAAPTMEEAGFGEHELVVWFELFAPKGTPDEIVNRLNTAVNKLLAEPQMMQIANQISMQPAGGTPQEAAQYQASEVENWANLVKLTGVKIN